MDIRVLKSQNIFYQIPSSVAAVLVDCGLVEQYTAPVKPKETFPEWGVVRLPHSGKPAIRHCANDAIAYFDGDVKRAKGGFQSQVWDGVAEGYVWFGPIPPDSVIRLYKDTLAEDEKDNLQRLVALDRPPRMSK